MTLKHISGLECGSGKVEKLNIALRAISEKGECRKCDEQGKITLTWKDGTQSRPFCPNARLDCDFGKRQTLTIGQNVQSEMLASGIPRRHVDNLPGKDNSTTRQVYLWNFRDFLTISGNPGYGKSFAVAAAIYRRCIDIQIRGNPGDSVRISQIYSWKTPYQLLNDRAVFSESIAVSVLVIDDLGREEATPQKKAAIAEIIGQRYDRKLATAITTNLNPEEIQDRYGTPTFQRLIESGVFVEADGTSARINNIEEAAS